MKLIFIRHAEPDYSIDSLTKKGWREAAILSDRTASWQIDGLYCSPLGRARDTAASTEEKIQKKAIVLPWLKEFSYMVKNPETGVDMLEWDLLPSYFTQQEDLHDRNKWFDTELMRSGGIKEHYQEVTDGLDNVLMKYGYVRDGGLYRVDKHNDLNIVFFCHLGVSFVCISHLIGVSPSVLWQGLFVAPSSVTVLSSEERVQGEAAFRCQIIGDVSHLKAAGEPISSSGYFADCFQG